MQNGLFASGTLWTRFRSISDILTWIESGLCCLRDYGIFKAYYLISNTFILLVNVQNIGEISPVFLASGPHWIRSRSKTSIFAWATSRLDHAGQNVGFINQFFISKTIFLFVKGQISSIALYLSSGTGQIWFTCEKGSTTCFLIHRIKNSLI